MKVFITGVTGYVGFAVAKQFLSQGYQVSGLVRTQEKAEHLIKLGISL